MLKYEFSPRGGLDCAGKNSYPQGFLSQSFLQTERQEDHNYFADSRVFFFKMMAWFAFVGLVWFVLIRLFP